MTEDVQMLSGTDLPLLPADGQPTMVPPLTMPQSTGARGQQFGGTGGRPPNGIPKFEMRAVRMANGEIRNVEYLTILTPGDPKAVPEHKVTDELRDMYRPWYEAWRAGIEATPHGTPLEAWPMMAGQPAQVMHLKSINVFTVEQLAEMADGNLHRIPMGRTLQNQAKAWLENKKDADAIERNRRESEAMRDGMAMLEAQNAALQQQLAELAAKVGTSPKADDKGDAEPTKRGPGRPRKSETTQQDKAA